MRALGPNRLAMVEGDGHVDEITLVGDRADIRTVAADLPTSTTSVAVVGRVAFVSICDFAALRRPDAPSVTASIKRVSFTPATASH